MNLFGADVILSESCCTVSIFNTLANLVIYSTLIFLHLTTVFTSEQEFKFIFDVD